MRSLPTTGTLDDTWHRRSSPWPPLGVRVAVCWQLYRDGVQVFAHGTARLLCTWEDSDGYVASTWQEGEGDGLFAAAPDFWRRYRPAGWVEPDNLEPSTPSPDSSPDAPQPVAD